MNKFIYIKVDKLIDGEAFNFYFKGANSNFFISNEGSRTIWNEKDHYHIKLNINYDFYKVFSLKEYITETFNE